MLLIPHTIVGIAVASTVGTVWALPLAFLSHFLVDVIPHWDPLIDRSTAKKCSRKWCETLLFVAVDFMIAFDIGLFFTWRALDGCGAPADICKAAIVFFSCFSANLPDGLLIPRLFFGKKWGWLEAYYKAHVRIQTKLSLPWGVLTQVAVAAAGLWLALR